MRENVATRASSTGENYLRVVGMSSAAMARTSRSRELLVGPRLKICSVLWRPLRKKPMPTIRITFDMIDPAGDVCTICVSCLSSAMVAMISRTPLLLVA